MSLASRKLQVGDVVTTDFSGRVTAHKIIERVEPVVSTSGVGFRVYPLVRGSSGNWIDADWFEPAPKQEGASDAKG